MAAMLIQSQARMRQAQQQYQGAINGFTILQSIARKLRTQAELKSQRDAAAIINRNIRTVAPQAELKAQRDAAAIINKNLQQRSKAKFKAQRDAAAIINRNIRTVAPKAKFKAQRDSEAQIDNLATNCQRAGNLTQRMSSNFRKWLVAFNQVLVSSRSMLTGKQWVELLDKKRAIYRVTSRSKKMGKLCWSLLV